ncbi:MAG: NifB/NifX family molybdenum-iron cluster-binding protein [Desulfomonilaceae bacterium]|jgi:predicted Fe-Mo cluster-binding NifX family protein
MKIVLIPLKGDEIAPRFDLAPEVTIFNIQDDGSIGEQRLMVMAHASPESLCELILREKVDVVICCGIEEEFYQYLSWKKVRVIDSVVGSCERIIDCFRMGDLVSGAILM